MKRDSNVMGIDIAKRVWLLFDSRVVDVPTDIEQVCEVEKPFILL
jgi:hypothetical protein